MPAPPIMAAAKNGLPVAAPKAMPRPAVAIPLVVRPMFCMVLSSDTSFKAPSVLSPIPNFLRVLSLFSPFSFLRSSVASSPHVLAKLPTLLIDFPKPPVAFLVKAIVAPPATFKVLRPAALAPTVAPFLAKLVAALPPLFIAFIPPPTILPTKSLVSLVNIIPPTSIPIDTKNLMTAWAVAD
ncbi:MAG: hypothetical protein BWX53_00540 [Parcubacteria group bacterium ADurb.Bin016]|nr:MAG: hypothetical protein BWX53_00540 [Parcubacteria group bacterium ADurb.Bin016]